MLASLNLDKNTDPQLRIISTTRLGMQRPEVVLLTPLCQGHFHHAYFKLMHSYDKWSLLKVATYGTQLFTAEVVPTIQKMDIKKTKKAGEDAEEEALYNRWKISWRQREQVESV